MTRTKVLDRVLSSTIIGGATLGTFGLLADPVLMPDKFPLAALLVAVVAAVVQEMRPGRRGRDLCDHEVPLAESRACGDCVDPGGVEP